MLSGPLLLKDLGMYAKVTKVTPLSVVKPIVVESDDSIESMRLV